MSDLLAIHHLSVGTLYFSDEEVDTVDVFPQQAIEEKRTQAQDLFLIFRGGVRYRIEVDFHMARYTTLLKLWQVFQLQDAFDVYPHFPDDPVTHYRVVWTNPNAFVERWRRGMPRALYTISATFEEPAGAICVPPIS